jgi:endonuclease/exonuclease/phosphatase family metal-dependent hydrolase
LTAQGLTERPRIVVASYNVHRCIGSDGRRDEERVARVIASLGADVVGLQEVESFPAVDRAGPSMQIGILGYLAGMQAVSGPTIERAHGSFGNAILTKLPVLEVRRVNLTWRTREPRGALDVVVQAPQAPIRIIATHLGLRPGERRFQVRRLIELAALHDGRLTVLLGDINEWLIYGRPLRWLHARFGEAPSRATFPARLPLFALDRVWVRPRTALRGVDVLRTREARAASDHLPVRAELSLETPHAPPDAAPPGYGGAVPSGGGRRAARLRAAARASLASASSGELETMSA